MKVAFITSGLLPVPAVKGGAIETLLDSFVKQNEKSKKIDIEIYSINDKKIRKLNFNHTKYIYISSFGNLLLRIVNKIFKTNFPINKIYQKKVIKLINQYNYDYVIIENYPELVLKLSKFKTIPYIHSDVFNTETDNCQEILSSCYKVITVSDYIKNRVLKIDSKQEKKVCTVYNSIDFIEKSENEIEQCRLNIRKKYGIKADDFVYAYSGRISKEKGVLELVKAFNMIDVPNKKLLIIGGIWYGSQKKNDYLEELESISDENIIYTGYVSHAEIQNLLYAIDVGVVPSICNEAAGLSVVEFMYTNNIVVASNMGGIKEYLNKDHNYLVECNDDYVNQLSISMEECYKNIDDIENIQISNNEFAKKFTIKNNYDEIIKVLESGE